MPFLKEALKAGVKAVTQRGGSSAAKDLAGKPLMGSIIKDVQKGVGDQRFLIMESGAEIPTTRSGINSLCRHFGDAEQALKFSLADESSQYMMAVTSLEYHLNRQKSLIGSTVRKTGGKPFASREMLEDYLAQHNQTLTNFGLEPTEMIMIKKPQQMYLPKRYADILEAAGEVEYFKK